MKIPNAKNIITKAKKAMFAHCRVSLLNLVTLKN